MNSSRQIATASPHTPWQMPIDPAIYDQKPFTAEEWKALELDFTSNAKTARTVNSIGARSTPLRRAALVSSRNVSSSESVLGVDTAGVKRNLVLDS